MSSYSKPSNVFDTLIEENPSYDELISIYQTLRSGTSEEPEVTVGRRALAYLIGDIIDYLDFVGKELEKAFGITRTEELERILNIFEYPQGSNSIERIHDFIGQWESIELYTLESVHVPADIDVKDPYEQRV